MSVKLSIAITTYNRLPYLKECIASILGQTFQDFLIYIFDDASTPSIKKEINKIGDSRIIFVGSEKNLGSIGNITRVLSFDFSSPYLMIFHDDDIMHPSALASELAVLDSRPELLFVGSNIAFFKNGNILKFDEEYISSIDYEIYKDNERFTLALLSGISLGFGSVIYRKNFLKGEVFDFNRFSVIADRPFLVTLVKKGPCAFIKNKLVNYRLHPEQDSNTSSSLKLKHILNLLSFYRSNLPAKLTWRQKRRFFNFSTNNFLDSYLRNKEGNKYFFDDLNKAKENGLINFWFLNRIGVRALMKILIKKIL